MKIEAKKNSIQANGSIILSALWICGNYLIQTNQFWNLGLEIPSIRDWSIYIPYIYCITLNDNHTKLNDKIQDNDLNFELTDKGNHLLLTSRPPRTKLKPNLLQNFLTKYNPSQFRQPYFVSK